MGKNKRVYYLYTHMLPDETGFLAVEEKYRSRLEVGDGLWLIGEEARFYRIEHVQGKGVFLKEEDASFEVETDSYPFGHVRQDGYGLPATRTPGVVMPVGENPLNVEVEHRGEVSGPGEMIIELYGRSEGGLMKRSTDEEAFLAESLEDLLRIQIQTMEITAEIGELWIRKLRQDERKNNGL